MSGVVVRTLLRAPRRMQIRSTLFFSETLGRNGRSCSLPALQNALAYALVTRQRTLRPVWIEDVSAPAYIRPKAVR
jgi:hypothetical protein